MCGYLRSPPHKKGQLERPPRKNYHPQRIPRLHFLFCHIIGDILDISSKDAWDPANFALLNDPLFLAAGLRNLLVFCIFWWIQQNLLHKSSQCNTFLNPCLGSYMVDLTWVKSHLFFQTTMTIVKLCLLWRTCQLIYTGCPHVSMAHGQFKDKPDMQNAVNQRLCSDCTTLVVVVVVLVLVLVVQ